MLALGVLREYRHIRKCHPGIFKGVMSARPRFIFDPSLTPDERDKKVLAGLNSYLKSQRFGAEPLGDSCRLTEYFSVALMLAKLFDGQHPEPSWPSYVSLKRVKAASQRVLAAETYARKALAQAIQMHLVDHHYRIDGRRYWATAKFVPAADGRLLLSLLLHREDVASIRVRRGRIWREAYPCSVGFMNKGVVAATIRPKELRRPAKGDPLPIYVSGHVFDHMHRVERRIPCKDGQIGRLHWLTWQSLHEPVLVNRPGDSFLAEFRLNGHRLGYFPLTVADGKVIALTFLFLTMDGTPESDALYKRLRVRRSDRERLKLDRLSTFTHPDVRDDAKLVAALTGCGCGHLFEFAREQAIDQAYDGCAEAIRRYLRL